MIKILSSIILIAWLPMMLFAIMYVDKNEYPILYFGIIIFLWFASTGAIFFKESE